MSRQAKFLEVVRALAVLALVFLNFAHAPLSLASAQTVSVGADAFAWCGAPGDDEGGGHAPCNACRIGSGIDLPPPAPALLSRHAEPAGQQLPAQAAAPILRRHGPILARGPPAA